ncbi:MAG: monovalent cation/H+ antiporter complex subunit F [Anaerolineales bacterium]|nr:monovalent cation/H+ antiporter complex subunit F [Anaerolineales bacterium]
MNELLNLVLYFALFIHVILVAMVVYRVWRGENAIDRLSGVELVGTLILAVLVLAFLINRNVLYLDITIGLAALGYIGTIALSRYVVNENIF